MRRFYVAPGLLDGDSVSIHGPLAQRLANVLRLKVGQRIVLFDGGGHDATVRLTSVSARSAAGDIESRAPGPAESRTRVHLYQSITKGERFDWLVEKATELGVASITPLLTARAVVKSSAGGARAERWHRIAVEAAEQCGRAAVPALAPPIRFEEAFETSTSVILLPYEDADHTAPSVADVLHERVDDVFASSSVSIFIGPEGGYEPAEVEHACAGGAAVVTLGDRVLRSETAGLVALTLVMQALGELG